MRRDDQPKTEISGVNYGGSWACFRLILASTTKGRKSEKFGKDTPANFDSMRDEVDVKIPRIE